MSDDAARSGVNITALVRREVGAAVRQSGGTVSPSFAHGLLHSELDLLRHRLRPWAGTGPAQARVMCEQCGSPGVTTPTEYGPLCDRCAFRQAIRDEQRATFAHLTPSTFGFDPYDDDPYD